MSNKEAAEQYITTWRDKDTGRLEEELTSLSNESNRRPDSYYFEVEEGILIDPHTNRSVIEFIDRKTPLGKVELRVAEKLGRWANDNESGISFWISPPFEGRYPCSKVIISKIGYTWEGQKTLLNSAVLFDADEKECLNVIPESEIEDPEVLRSTLFFTKDSEEKISEIIKRVNKYTKQEKESSSTKDQSIFFARMISSGLTSRQIVHEMHQTGFLGNFKLSCATANPTFSEYMVANSNVVSSEAGKFVKTCGNCGANINSVIQRGYRCPKCGGIYEGC